MRRLVVIALVLVTMLCMGTTIVCGAQDVQLKDYNTVPTLTQGQSYSIHGFIRSKKKMSRVEIGVVNAKTNKWTIRYDKKISAKTFNISKADQYIKFGTLKSGTYKYRIYAHVGKKVYTLLNQQFVVKAKPKTKADKIASKAKECAYPYGTSKKTYSYPNGKPKPEYKRALDQAYPDRSKWGKQTRAGASCDVFVGTVIRASGVDSKFPRGLDGVIKHCKDNSKWTLTKVKSIDKMKAGDIVYQEYKGGGGHISVYLGNNKIANAHYNGKTYGIIEKASDYIKSSSKYKVFNVYRAK